MSLHLLVIASETPDEQTARRKRSGMASHETYARTLRDMAPGSVIEHRSCVDGRWPSDGTALAAFDGVFFAGSPIRMHEDTPEVREAARFMTSVFEAGVPSFGSCAGLQIAAVAAGGAVRPRKAEMEAGFSRGIVATDEGRGHPMLRDRPDAWDAPAMHSAVVDRLPAGGTVLARTRDVPVEAAEIRSGIGTFWGVQYHPELALWEIADALGSQAETLVAQGLARNAADIDRYAAALKDLDEAPDRRDLTWQLGLDAEVVDPRRRRSEIRAFLEHVSELAVSRA